MSEEDREQLLRGLHVGLVVDERRAEFAQGDFLVRNVLGAREADGALAVGATVEVGQTLQFQIRDARAADADLRAAARGPDAAAARCCSPAPAAARRLFGRADHDADASCATRSARSRSPAGSAPASSVRWAATTTSTASPPASRSSTDAASRRTAACGPKEPGIAGVIP